jgi:hypothetical protein
MQVAKAHSTTSNVLPKELLIEELLVSKKTIDPEIQSIIANQQKSMHRFLEANCDCV